MCLGVWVGLSGRAVRRRLSEVLRSWLADGPTVQEAAQREAS
jgi:hypothetical protein